MQFSRRKHPGLRTICDGSQLPAEHKRWTAQSRHPQKKPDGIRTWMGVRRAQVSILPCQIEFVSRAVYRPFAISLPLEEAQTSLRKIKGCNSC